MKIILIKDTAKLGQRGSVIEVADSYAMNVLIPKGNAIQGTPSALAKWKQNEESKKIKKELETNTFAQVVHKLRNEKIEIVGKKSDAKGQLFAAVHESDIADAIYKVTNFSLSPKQIIIEKQIKSLGEHKVVLESSGVKEEIKIEIK